ncbi:MAG: cytochrome c biogenesis protein CcsA [Candidatus Zipacnadales bacterium]
MSDKPRQSPSSLLGAEGISPLVDPLDPERLDGVTYRLITMGFVLLTLVIITGMAWAQYTWHRWWSWDPKETSAAVAWLVYLLYLHGRRVGWSKPLTAWVAIVGAFSVIFCYAGVNFLGGLHSYGAPTGSVLQGAQGAFEGMEKTEASLAKGFLVCYLGAFVAYLALVTLSGALPSNKASSLSADVPAPEPRRGRSLYLIGTVPLALGFVFHTVALVYRSLQAGHLPFSSGYEYAASFAWAMVLIFLILEQQIRTPVLGAISLPLILLVLAYGFLWFSNKEVSPLPVALQNRFWLHLHVAIAIISYATLIIATATAALYLAKSRRQATSTG